MAWFAVGATGFRLLHTLWDSYALAEPTHAFTTTMQLSRLLLGLVCSFTAGSVAAWVVGRVSPAPLSLGVLILLLTGPVHYATWNSFPVWYHTVCMLMVFPVVSAGALLTQHLLSRPKIRRYSMADASAMQFAAAVMDPLPSAEDGQQA